MGGGETRIYSRNGAPIGLIAAGGSIVAAPVRKVEQILRHFSNFSGDGKLRSQRVQCIQIMDDCRLACARQGQTECIRLNIGIAVAVPASPASCTEKTGRTQPKPAT